MRTSLLGALALLAGSSAYAEIVNGVSVSIFGPGVSTGILGSSIQGSGSANGWDFSASLLSNVNIPIKGQVDFPLSVRFTDVTLTCSSQDGCGATQFGFQFNLLFSPNAGGALVPYRIALTGSGPLMNGSTNINGVRNSFTVGLNPVVVVVPGGGTSGNTTTSGPRLGPTFDAMAGNLYNYSASGMVPLGNTTTISATFTLAPPPLGSFPTGTQVSLPDSFTAVVGTPEGSSLLLVGTGLGLLAFSTGFRRRRNGQGNNN